MHSTFEIENEACPHSVKALSDLCRVPCMLCHTDLPAAPPLVGASSHHVLSCALCCSEAKPMCIDTNIKYPPLRSVKHAHISALWQCPAHPRTHTIYECQQLAFSKHTNPFFSLHKVYRSFSAAVQHF